MNANYIRVLPRDLFNEAKLLKCLGMLSLMILDCIAPNNLKMNDDGGSFRIALSDDGALTVINVIVSISGINHRFQTTYNSRSAYPFFLVYPDESQLEVFDDDGALTDEFIAYCKSLSDGN